MPYSPYEARPYTTLKALWRGEIVEVDGIQFRQRPGTIEPGDFYIAERNTGPKLLIARSINTEHGWITPEGNNYPFDTGECVRVEEVTQGENR